MILKVGKLAVFFPLSCITQDIFFSVKVDSKQDKQFNPFVLYYYNAVGILYFELIL